MEPREIGKRLVHVGSEVCQRYGSARPTRLTTVAVALLWPVVLTLEPPPLLGVNAGLLTGLWQCELTRPNGEMPFALDLTQSGDRVIGKIWSPEGHLTVAASTLTNGLITLELPSPGGAYILTANFARHAFTGGQITVDGKLYGTWHGEKAPAPGTNGGIESLADGRIRTAAVVGLREAYLPIAFPSSHAANLIPIRNGDLLCTWYAGVWEGESNVAIVMSRLRKGSHQWTVPVAVARKPGYAFENPVPFEPASGELWLFHTAQAANAGQSNSQIFRLMSTDSGRHWSQSKLLFPEAGSFDRQRLLVNGDKWIFPMYYTPTGAGGDDALRNYSAMQASTDRGVTWRQCTVPESHGLVQPDVVEVSPRHLQAFFRSRWADWVYKSFSSDGCTWTVPAATQLPNNNSSIQVIRLNNGHLVIAFNNSQAAPKREKSADAARWPLSVALSTDSGRTWPWVRDVETGNEVPITTSLPDMIAGISIAGEKESFFDHLYSYEYPSIIQTADGVIHMAYTFRRRTIKCLAFDETWIKGGGTRGKFKGNRAE